MDIEDNKKFAENSITANITTYEEKLKMLQKIAKNIENQDSDLLHLVKQMELAQSLVEDCQLRLRTIEEQLPS